MNRVRRSALASVAAGVVLISIAYLATWAAWAPRLALWAMITGIALQLGGVTVLGGGHRARPNRTVIIAALFVGFVIVAGFGAAVLSPEVGTTPTYLLGLPRRAAIVLLGVGILPFFALPFLYAADFDADGLDDASLERLREECRQLRETQAREASQ